MSNFLPRRWILRKIGAVPAAELAAKKEELKQSQQDLAAALTRTRSLESQLHTLSQELDAAKAAKATADQLFEICEWIDPYHVEFLSLRNDFRELVRNTVLAWRQFATGLRLGVLGQFKGGINPAGLYWALTHASLSGKKSILQLDKEDVMTSDFVVELQRQLDCAKKLLGSVLDVYAGEIHKKLKPALKEISVGADLLLLVSGDGLVPKGGLRLLWLQFKQATDVKKPMDLNVYRTPNAAGGTQLGALRVAHRPKLGSFGLYALAAMDYDFFASIPVADLASVDPVRGSTCHVDLAEDGTRLQELVLLLSSDPTHGHFDNSAAVLKFVDDLASQNAIVPLAILSVSSGEELVSASDIARQIKAGWDRRLEAHIASLTRAQKQSLQLDDDGPSLSI
ncbi:hypothetical protein A9977_12390 [Variovorax sp. UMC13]|nr:hypothetical protein [Variovorax sp. UMC13]